MEDLNKQQLILLTLLVSFITSIATGIITATLLQEAPVEVTNTINRVVEKTIEKAVPGESGKTVVTEVQVVSEEDLVLDSIDKGASSIVRIKSLGFDGVELTTGLGVVVADGVVVTDARSLSGSSNNILFGDNRSFGVAKTYKSGELVFLKVGKAANDKYNFNVASLGNSDSLKLGQSIIAVSGKQSNSVSIGRISQLRKSDSGNIENISSDLSSLKSQFGSPILNLSGEFVGIEAPLGEGENFLSFLPINTIKASLKTAISELSKP